MIDKSLVPANLLVKRFQEACDRWAIDSRAQDLPKYVQNLHTVQRDFYLMEETPIELPRWLTEIG